MSTACLLVIGNEILSGRTQDRNIAWIASELNASGVRLAEARIIPDDREAIIAAVNRCRPLFSYLFTTGGIGPTHDDITSASVAAAFGVPLRRDPEAARLLERHYGREQLNAARLKMADVPEGAALIPNPVSAAPGFRLENVYVMAGVPSIMQAMFGAIRQELKGGAKMLSRTVSAYITEGVIAAALTGIQREFPEVEIGSYPFIRNQRLGVSLVARAADAARLDAAYGRIRQMLMDVTTEIEEDNMH